MGGQEGVQAVRSAFKEHVLNWKLVLGRFIWGWRVTKMVLWSYPPTPPQLAVTACLFVAGASIFAVGAHLSLANIAPQQARAKARKEFVKDRLRKLLGD